VAIESTAVFADEADEEAGCRSTGVCYLFRADVDVERRAKIDALWYLGRITMPA
jgi:hypothetical protein